MRKVPGYIMWLLRLDTYDFYFVINLVMCFTAMIYTWLCIHGYIKHFNRRLAFHESILVSDCWVMKNIVFLTVMPICIIMGNSWSGRLSCLLIFCDTVTGYFVYPVQTPHEKRVHEAEFYRQFFRNVLLVVVMGTWNVKYLADYQLHVSDVLRISVGIIIFFTAMYLKLNAFTVERYFGVEGRTEPLTGGLYDTIASPHSLFIVIQWIGFHLATTDYIAIAFATRKACIAIGQAYIRFNYHNDRHAAYGRNRGAILPYL